MIKTTMTVSGMTCGMCEAHVNDAIRAALPVKKVTSSRKKKETVILSEKLLDPEEVRQVINNAGYYMLSFKTEQVQKRSAFSRLLGKKG